ncbi:MAG: DUF2332 domain-containing protein [Solirubrobacterales bacterium]
MTANRMTERQEEMIRYLHGQADVCAMLGSPLYERLLDDAAEHVERGGVLWQVLEPFAGAPSAYGVPLKLMGAVHRLVLAGAAPQLAALYPSAGGELDLDRAWPAFEQAVAEHARQLPELIERPVQTNEVGRCAALLGGFLTVARQSGLPLRLLELGASAGLNLRWDRYLYESGEQRWGDPASNVRLKLDPDSAPPLDVEAIVGSRRGCDMEPLDPCAERDRLTLLSYVWPDQRWRFEALRAALAEAESSPVIVEQADAAPWLEHALEEKIPNTATVVYHSLVMFWMDDGTRERIARTIHSAGGRATKRSPLAWLRMESGGERAEVRLRVWPDGEDRVIARAGYHGRPVEWLASDADSDA